MVPRNLREPFKHTDKHAPVELKLNQIGSVLVTGINSEHDKTNKTE